MTEQAAAMAVRRMRVPASVDQLATLRAFVRNVSGDLGAGPAEVGDLVQAVDECVANAIIHGYRGRAGFVEVEIERSGKELLVRLRDRAPQFDPTMVPSPDLDLPLSRRRPGGMGVFLARELTDRMTYRHADNGNELTLAKRVQQEEERDVTDQR
jgi:serine/threonine-protein kinase RsbW